MLIARATELHSLLVSHPQLGSFWQKIGVCIVPFATEYNDPRSALLVIPSNGSLGKIAGEIPSFCLDPEHSAPDSRASIFMRTRVSLPHGQNRSGLLLEYVPCGSMAEGGAFVWYDNKCGGSYTISPKPIGNCATAWSLDAHVALAASATLSNWNDKGRPAYVAPPAVDRVRASGGAGHAVPVKSYMRDPAALLGMNARYSDPFALPLPVKVTQDRDLDIITAASAGGKRKATVTE